MFNRRRNQFSMANFRLNNPTITEKPADEPTRVVVELKRPTVVPDLVIKDKIPTNHDNQVKIQELRVEDHKDDLQRAKSVAVFQPEGFESLKSKFLQFKNKALFIKRNKNLIKSLKNEDQRKFILLAREHL